MGDVNLYDSLNMFVKGMKELSFSRALDDANQQVQDIKATETNEQNQRAKIQQISNALTQHMVGLGMPDTAIARAASTFGGTKEFANANEMNASAALSGDRQLAGMAQQQQKFEEDPKMALEQKKLQQAYALAAPAKQEKINEFDTKQFKGIGEELDSTKASSRTGFGKAGMTGVNAQRVESLLGDPASFSKLTPQDATLIADGVINLVKGGVATKEEMENLVPGMANKSLSQIKTFLSSNPSALNSPGLFDKMRGWLDKEKDVNNAIMQKAILKRATNMAATSISVKRNQEGFKATVASSLRDLYPGITPDDVIVDPKKGVTTKQIMAIDDSASKGTKLTKQAFADLQSKNPKDVEQAKSVFRQLGVDPSAGLDSALLQIKTRAHSGQIRFK